jgi:hypothetical protein
VTLTANTAHDDIDLDTDINGSLVATAAHGTIDITNAGGLITLGALKAGSSISVSSTGGISVGAGTTLTAGGLISLTTTGNTNVSFLSGVTVTDSLDISTGNGLFDLTGILNLGGNNLTTSNLNSVGGATITSNGSQSDININGATTGGDVALTTTGTGTIALDSVNLGSNTLSLSTAVAGSVTLDGSTVSVGSLNASNLLGALVIGTNVSISTSKGLDLSHVNGIDAATAGVQSLSIDAGTGSVELADVGKTRALKSLKVKAGSIDAGSVTTIGGGQSYTGTLDLSGSLSNSSSGDIDVIGDATFGAASGIVNSGGGDVDITGGATFGSASSIVNSGGGDVDVKGNVVFAAFSSIANNGGGDIMITGDVTFGTSSSIASSGGAIDVTGNVTLGASSSIANSGGGGIDIGGDATFAAAATIRNGNGRGGDIAIGGDITLNGAANIDNSSGGAITVGGSVDGKQQLTLDADTGKVRIVGAVGSNSPLVGLSLKGRSIELDSAVTTVLNQNYVGSVAANASLTSAAGAIDFSGGSLDIKKPLTIQANSIGFNGGDHSVTTSAAATLALIPETTGTQVVIGGTANGELNLSGSALSGYQGSLYIGGLPVDPSSPDSGVKGPPVQAGDITISSNLTLGGAGALVITSMGDININATLQADTVIVGAHGSVLNASDAGVLVGDTIVVVGNAIGAEGKDIVASALSGSGSLSFGTNGNQALFNLTGLTKDTGDNTPHVYALDLDVTINTNAVLQNSGQQAAANQQTGGLLGSGFIDVSVFQQISLYDVNGSGIQLPGDQCEEESSTGTGCGQ